jgi:hypothetical protein
MMALYTVANGDVSAALDVDQYFNLLTGAMTDQPVTIANRIRATNTGAASASGLMGGVNGAAPASGAFATGDAVIDQTGTVRVCTAGGTPGTWGSTGTQIEKKVLGASAASVTFSGIPSTFSYLRLAWQARSDLAGSSTTSVNLRINGDSAANYQGQYSQVSGTTTNTGIDSSERSSAYVGKVSSAGWAANSFGIGVVEIFDWSHPASTAHLMLLSDFTLWIDTTQTISGYTGYRYGSTGPYTSLTMLLDDGNLVAGSSFTLWGC